MSILEVTELTHTFGDKLVFKDTGMQLFTGDKMGLTGLNGAGKSTFINILAENIMPDEGRVKWDPRARVGYLDQQAKIRENVEVKNYLRGAFRELFEADRQLGALNIEISACRDEDRLSELLKKAGECQSRLESGNFYSVDSQIEKVAAGLGITAFGMETPVRRLSGGQRAKLMLAKLLLEDPDVLLLDEPTNFLDREHIDWLAKFLNSFKGSFILVSHDFGFLNRVVNCICDIDNYHITRYNGSYEDFVRLKELHAEEYERSYEHQQKEIAKLEDYISRNLARASTTAMAQSRRKKLEKMDRIAKPQHAAKPTFTFMFRQVSKKTLIKINKLEVGYTQPLLPKISMQLKTGEKVAITGFNGIGKTTFLKTVAGLLPKLSGSVRFDEEVVIGYYEQENVWEDPQKTAFSEIKDAFPRLKDKEVRGHLAKCGLRAEQAMQSLATLSGGEQAKVKICRLTLTPCNVLILDEPTNHLDVNAIEQLKEAVLAFEGLVLFVSHSKSFCDEIMSRKLDMEALFDE
jgi:ATPase subunit of ABC transporter with duplicated ATPase domains